MASVIFKPGEKAKYVAPGEEEMSGKAEELFHLGQTAEKEGNLKRAIRAYRTLVQRHPKMRWRRARFFALPNSRSNCIIIS